ncbi:MAG: DUF4314 domain-containing protein [Oscillospiraceae bacterium]|nr:DUF4314 domain-containing protein [Oscillospiraceae bacterium]
MVYDEKKIERLRALYPPGTVICLDRMDDPYPVESGSLGKVEYIDDAGNIHMKWRNGSSLALVPETDDFHIVNPKYDQSVAATVRRKIGEFVSSELKLHELLLETARDIAARAVSGEDSFDIDKLFEDTDFRNPIIHAISEMVGAMPEIMHSAVHDIGVPFQNVLTVMPNDVSEDEEQVDEPDESEGQNMGM